MYTKNEVFPAKYVGPKPYNFESIVKSYVPTLMPLIPMGVAKITPTTLSKSCYINAAECRPSVSSMINTQNFVSAVRNIVYYKNPRFVYGDSIKVATKDEDFLRCKLALEND